MKFFRQLFGPSIPMFLVKVVLTIPVFYLINYFDEKSRSLWLGGNHYGVPFAYQAWGTSSPDQPVRFILPALILDVLIWFIAVSIVITLVSLLFRKKNA